jgi:3,4-dihydroxyphenylacetate 2,3-dioxygenase
VIDTGWEQPGFNIIRAAHAEYVVTDLHRARHFYVDVLGFVVTVETPAAIYLRGYEEAAHHSLILRKGQEPAVAHLAFRVASEEDLDALTRHFQAHGLTSTWAEDVEPGQGRALRLQDPLGFPVEFFATMEREERLLQRFDLHRGAQVMRIDHFNLHVPDVQAAYDYYKTLGFRCSEYTSTDPPDEKLWAAWMYRKQDVHDVALMNGRGPRLHHLGFWVTDTSSVLRTCDLLAATGNVDAIERGPGRHGLSNAFFLYLRDPDGHRIELYTNDYFTGDSDFEPLRWSVNDLRRGTFWGHAAPASWFEESSRVQTLDGDLVDLQEQLLKERPHTVT